MRTKVLKWGNSLGLRIPKSFAEEIRVQDGSIVDLGLKNGRLVIRVIDDDGPALSELLAGITDRNRHAEADFGDPAGGEAW